MLCKLCLRDSKLCRSHVIPEYFYKPAYDDKHRAYELTREPFREKFLQKGHRERLLCRSCEARIAEYEDYVHRVWYHEGRLPEKVVVDPLVITGLDYSTFKLFHLSVLWRASVATGQLFANVSLGPHEEVIRGMILNEDPGHQNQYGFFAEVLVDDDQSVVQAVIVQPVQTKPEAGKVCIFVYGGCAWWYIVESELRDTFAEYFLTREGRLTLRKRCFYEFPFVMEFGAALRRDERRRRQRA